MEYWSFLANKFFKESTNIFFNITVAGINIGFDFVDLLDMSLFDSFLTFEKLVDVLVNVRLNSKIELPESKILINENLVWRKASSKRYPFLVHRRSELNESVSSILEASINFKKSVITMQSCSLDETPVSLSNILFRNSLLFYEGLVIHASAIKYANRGLVFTAPSSIGKSTMANLWKVHKDALILNDDNPAIRLIGKKCVVFGNPWSGSNRIFANDSANLFAIIVLEQATENKIRKLNTYEYMTRVLPRVYLPYFDQNLMKRALENFEKIVTSVPVYLLQFRPDQEAVELVHQCLF